MKLSLEAHVFLALLLAVLALIPGGAHGLELVQKLRLPAEEYRIVQQLYRGWALLGVVVLLALATTLLLMLRVRHHPGLVGPAAVAFGCLLLTQVVFWSATFPVNRRTENWTKLPGDWMRLRLQWEWSHAASAVLTLAAVVSLIVLIMRKTD
jgi:hypothetical protein